MTRRLRVPRRPVVIGGLVIAAAWVLAALAAPLIAPQGFDHQAFAPLQPPSFQHLFGTDELGRDVFSRVVWGAQRTLPVALLIVCLAGLVGTILGAVAGYFRGPVDGVIMRFTDLVFAFPAIILALVVSAAIGHGLVSAVVAITLVGWPHYARVTRSLVLSIGESDYVWSARLLGASSLQALRREVLPNIVGPVVVLATLDFGSVILLLAALSFLGLGAQPPAPEWGAMVADGIQHFQDWWLGMFPGLAIFTVVLAFNFIGDALRDRFDPSTFKDVVK